MRRYFISIVVAYACLSTLVLGHADVEWNIQKKLHFETPPLDMAVSGKGRWIFVLAEPGRIDVFNGGGELRDRIVIDKSIDGIESGPRENILYLMSREKKSVHVLNLEFIYDIDTSGSPFKGSKDAPVEITVFSEFQCPYCARLVPLLDDVFDKYPDRVRIVFKNFPLRRHKYARPAAAAALAAHRQGKFWPFHDLLFKYSNRLNNDTIDQVAKKIDLDKAAFDKDRNAPWVQEKIARDVRDASKAHVNSTPTVFVNGRRVKNRSMAGFQALIEKELAGK